MMRVTSIKSPLFKCIARRLTTIDTKLETRMPMQNMPSPNSLPILGTRLSLLLAGGAIMLHEYIDKRHKALGQIFKEKMQNTDIVFISNPKLMKTLFLNLEGKHPSHILPESWILYEKLYGPNRGLFFMDGEEWLHNRRIVNKYLLRDDFEKFIEMPVKKTVEDFICHLKADSVDGVVQVKASEFYILSIKVLIAILVGPEALVQRSQHFEEYLRMFADNVKRIFNTTTKMYSLPASWCYKLNLKCWQEFKESVDASLLMGQRIINDIIHDKHFDKQNGLVKKLCEEGVEEDMMLRIVVDLIIAAGDTTAYTTLWTLYLLSMNPTFLDEIEGADISAIKNVIKESMRLYPVAPFLTRILPKDCLLDSYEIKGGTPIVASIYTSGRDEQYFSKAESFLPYRWDKNDPRKPELTNHETSASMPFAFGARSCIGKKIAMSQLIETILQITSNFDIKCKNDKNVRAITSQILVPDQTLEFSFTDKRM